MHIAFQRPQPIGLHAYPAGLLVLPTATGTVASQAHEVLMRGATPEAWPDEWEFFADALRGDREGAIRALVKTGGPLGAYNRYVLTGDSSLLPHVQGEPALEELAALAAFTLASGELPAMSSILDGELLAHALMVHAASAIERGDTDAALQALKQSAREARGTSPLLAALALRQAVELLPPDAIEERIALLRSASGMIGNSTDVTATDVRLLLALALHESASAQRARLLEAVNAYQDILRHGVSRESTPEVFALVQNNLGLAYAAMPMVTAGDKLRLAVAVQCFREALTVYQRDTHLEQWASTTLNLANALQYMPSAHPRENLIEAVNAYEEVLSVRNRALDPVGYARVQANQGTALAHLGMFAPALDKLHEAHKLLHWHGEPDAAQALLDQVERINAQLHAPESLPAGGA